jgi:hypothetical protein
VPNQIPLDQNVAGGSSVSSAAMTPIAKAWSQAKAQMFQGKMAKADSEDPYTMNHWAWYEATGFTRPYPGEKTVRWPSDFASRIAHPNFDLDDQN